jgi:hypothetical protein
MRKRLSGARAARGACVVAALGLVRGAAAKDGDYGPPSPPFGDWMAHGSGCQGGATGDVVEEIVPTNDPLVWRVRFRLASFRLRTDERAADAPLTFARECGLRVVVAPPRGLRATFVGSTARVVARKSAGAALTLAGALRLGPEPLGRRMVTYEAGAPRAGDEVFDFGPGASTPMPSLACGESRIAGLDLTWIVKRASATETAAVEIGSPGTAEIEVRLERC